MKYTALLGNYWKVQPFSDVPLKLEHKETLPAIVTYKDSNTAYIYTDLQYDVGQKVSVGGFPINGRKFQLIELSITDFPVFEEAQIIEKEDI